MTMMMTMMLMTAYFTLHHQVVIMLPVSNGFLSSTLRPTGAERGASTAPKCLQVLHTNNNNQSL
jgi:hypothetical protein